MSKYYCEKGMFGKQKCRLIIDGTEQMLSHKENQKTFF